MSILNYFFIGAGFTFLIDGLMHIMHKNPLIHKVINNWGMWERFMCILIWPIAVVTFCLAFFKAIFRK